MIIKCHRLSNDTQIVNRDNIKTAFITDKYIMDKTEFITDRDI